MAKEILAVPEDHLEEVIQIIRAGLGVLGHITTSVREALEQWCNEEWEYLHRYEEEEKA